MGDPRSDPGAEPSVLARISTHLDSLSGMVFLLEEALGATLNLEEMDLDRQRLTELQSMDFIRQSLEDLALLVHFIDLHIPKTIQDALPAEDLARKVKLSSTKKLLGPAISQQDNPGRDYLGEVDLF